MSRPIIAFSKDWNEDPTSNHHVLRELAKTRRVVWLNSLSTRVPSMSSRDLGKIKRKLVEFTTGVVNPENDLWVATPLVLPLPHNPIARIVNRHIVRRTIAHVRAQLGITEFDLWTFLPNTADYIGTLDETLAVYYCVDEWATFPGLDAAATRTAEERLLRRVDVTFATSKALAAAKRAVCSNTFHAPHGVDYAKFARALDPATKIPADLAALPSPRVGFFGTLRDFIDFDLLAEIARSRPEWSVVLVGQQLSEGIAKVRDLPNVHLLGRRSHDELPGYCKGFDVGLVPYRIDGDVKFINPLKLREYLCAGLSVVSTDMPEVQPYAHLCHLAPTPAAAIAAIERALTERDPALRRMRSEAMQSETWEARVAAVVSAIARVERERDLRAQLLPEALAELELVGT
ncbi:MAG: glycosyltransferase [Kofleriaceae bacterium]|nr:glycosyltransferase [Kofleriaceae bacterium]